MEDTCFSSVNSNSKPLPVYFPGSLINKRLRCDLCSTKKLHLCVTLTGYWQVQGNHPLREHGRGDTVLEETPVTVVSYMYRKRKTLLWGPQFRGVVPTTCEMASPFTRPLAQWECILLSAHWEISPIQIYIRFICTMYRFICNICDLYRHLSP